MKYPEIRIKKSFLLNGRVIPLLLPELESQNRTYEAADEFIEQKVLEYTNEWGKYQDDILSAMCDVLDLEFKQNIIDVYVVPFSNSFSDPMVISTKYTSERFIEVFTHELIHRLLTDNTRLPLKQGDKLLPLWKDMFGSDHTFITLVHIPVNAILKFILLDILNAPERLQRDMTLSGRSKDYDKAWQYVDRNDYKRVIQQLKGLYNS